jgi:hypothetical protein
MPGDLSAMPEMCRLLLPLPRLRTIRCFDPREKARKAPAEPVKANGVTVEIRKTGNGLF